MPVARELEEAGGQGALGRRSVARVVQPREVQARPGVASIAGGGEDGAAGALVAGNADALDAGDGEVRAAVHVARAAGKVVQACGAHRIGGDSEADLVHDAERAARSGAALAARLLEGHAGGGDGVRIGIAPEGVLDARLLVVVGSGRRGIAGASGREETRRRQRGQASPGAIGQPTTLVNTANNGGVTARSLGGGANALVVDGGKLFVADPANDRVLIWNTIPAASGVAADVVLGQPDFTSSGSGTGLAQMNAPAGVAVLDGNLIVSDTGNERLLVFEGIPTTSVAADRSWDPRTVRFSLPGWYDGEQLAPYAIGAYAGRLYVAQTGRVLVLPDIFSM